MLYIKFKISDTSKYIDFQKLFDHLVEVREVGIQEFDEPDYDWETETSDTQEIKRYERLFPEYANDFLESYINYDTSNAGVYGFDILGIFNYLEYTFEVDMDNLAKINEDEGIVEFSTGNYPFGGIERFLITLKAFELVPTECFNGFIIYEFDWKSDYEYTAIERPEKTKEYIARFRK